MYMLITMKYSFHCQAFVHVTHKDNDVDICGRMNADAEGSETAAMEYLWAQMAPVLLLVHQLIQSWQGLFYKVCVKLPV